MAAHFAARPVLKSGTGLAWGGAALCVAGGRNLGAGKIFWKCARWRGGILGRVYFWEPFLTGGGGVAGGKGWGRGLAFGPEVLGKRPNARAVSRLGHLPKVSLLDALGLLSAERWSVAKHCLIERSFKSPRFNDRGYGYTLP